MNKLRGFMLSKWSAFSMVVGTIVAFAAHGAAVASATCASDDTVCTGFGSAQTSLLAYIALGIGVIVALLLAGIGVRLLVKYVRKAASAA
jgi:hypothetical protein